MGHFDPEHTGCIQIMRVRIRTSGRDGGLHLSKIKSWREKKKKTSKKMQEWLHKNLERVLEWNSLSRPAASLLKDLKMTWKSLRAVAGLFRMENQCWKSCRTLRAPVAHICARGALSVNYCVLYYYIASSFAKCLLSSFCVLSSQSYDSFYIACCF